MARYGSTSLVTKPDARCKASTARSAGIAAIYLHIHTLSFATETVAIRINYLVLVMKTLLDFALFAVIVNTISILS